MALHPVTQTAFKDMAVSLFNSLIVLQDDKYLTPEILDAQGNIITPSVSYPVRMYASTNNKQESSDISPVQIGDRIFIFIQDEIPVIPVKDGAIIYQGERFEIIKVQSDSANATWMCHGRKK